LKASVNIPKGFARLPDGSSIQNHDYVFAAIEERACAYRLEWQRIKRLDFEWIVKPGVIAVRRSQEGEHNE
jgi:hypothetical protein